MTHAMTDSAKQDGTRNGVVSSDWFGVFFMAGRSRNEASRDAGTIRHAVRLSAMNPWSPSLCGQTPRRGGNGWMDSSGTISCPACAAIANDDRFPILCSDGTVVHDYREARAKEAEYPGSFTTNELSPPNNPDQQPGPKETP